MSMSIMTKQGEVQVPTRSGGGKSRIAGQAAADGGQDHRIAAGT